MQCENVLVSCHYNSDIAKSDKESITINASGIKFCKDWVLLHGSVLLHFRLAKKILTSPRAVPGVVDIYSSLPKVSISYYEESIEREAQLFPKLTTKKGKIVYMWKCPILSITLNNLFEKWSFGRDYGSTNHDDEVNRIFLPSFILVHLGDNKVNQDSIQNALAALFEISSKRSPIRGEEIYIDSTPFGNEIFFNSRTSGTVCNCVGLENCLVLSDASSAVCAEGAPVFLDERKEILGMVLSSLSWWKGEWVGLTLVGCLAPSLHQLKFLKHLNPQKDNRLTNKRLILTNLLDTIDSMVVLVKCGESWGSGISVGKNYFLTCAHVVENYSSNSLVLFCKGSQVKGKVIFKTPKDKAYDLALLYGCFDDSACPSIANISSIAAVKGERILAVGYPFFDVKKKSKIRPTITNGLVANVNMAMIQTSCCVQSGFSGGAIVRVVKEIGKPNLSCEVIGIIVCNTKDDKHDVCFPHVNMAIPLMGLKKSLQSAVAKLGAPEVNFVADRDDVQSLWRFEPPASRL